MHARWTRSFKAHRKANAEQFRHEEIRPGPWASHSLMHEAKHLAFGQSRRGSVIAPRRAATATRPVGEQNQLV